MQGMFEFINMQKIHGVSSALILTAKPLATVLALVSR